ncbi:MAG: hypothetical protein ACD_76C00105G0006 [uncultured bacterium]|nr:MAG: hypothetical protein ACD_76C00105G0006 [uncultured bacterium]HBD04990.1 lysine--tRNA ligase [Candidatus Uhrbacteria bacterium]
MIDEEAARRERLSQIQKNGINAYPARSLRTHTIARALSAFQQLEESHDPFTIVGRVRSRRVHGGVAFLDLEDGTERMQAVCKKDAVGDDVFDSIVNKFDIADFLQISGTAFTTKTSQKSILASGIVLLSKALLPLPEKWHGLSDIEARFRKRYLDLIANPQVRSNFITRDAIVQTIRNFLRENGYMEVETPILQTLAGGASAKPFVTHHNALEMDMYLRVAPELFLKRLIVGGFERVFEFAKCFRNEGVDHSHNPEFTQVEGYQAYMDYEQLMEMIEQLMPKLAVASGKDSSAVSYAGKILDFTPPYERITFRDAVLAHAKIDINEFEGIEDARKSAKNIGIEFDKTWSYGKLLDEIYKETTRPHLVQPMFLIDHPVELSPLAKKKQSNPKVVERFQLLIDGMEVVNAFSELNDPLDQEERFRQQQDAREGGDAEAQPFDSDYVEALMHGMPPTAGFGIGIDRLTSIFTDTHNIKEVILFPTLKNEQEK